MRTTTKTLAGLLLAASLAGCGPESTGPHAVPSAADNPAVHYSQCMRDNGVPQFPDPDEKGALDLDLDKLGVRQETVDAAAAKCRQFLPNGGAPQKIDPERLERARRYAQCMRDNGVPKFPDPDPYGGIALNPDKLGMDPTGPAMKKAEDACAQLHGGDGGAEFGTSGG